MLLRGMNGMEEPQLSPTRHGYVRNCWVTGKIQMGVEWGRICIIIMIHQPTWPCVVEYI